MTGVTFRETLSGTVHSDRMPDALRLDARIEIAHVRDGVGQTGRLTGSVTWGERSPITSGAYELVSAPDAPMLTQVRYRAHFEHDGDAYVLAAEKTLHDDPGWDLWADLSTAHVRIHRDAVDGPLVASGVLRLAPGGALEMARSLSASGSDSARAVGRFGRSLFRSLWETYAGAAGVVGPDGRVFQVDPDDPCPPRPPLRPGQDAPDAEVLGFEPQPMVKWFTPSELARAGAEAVVSELFGAYADNREIQAVRGAIVEHDYADLDEVWFDYTADLGDGFDATYTVARLLAEEALPLRDPTEAGLVHDTRRGRMLVLGGDQVYPTAKREEYRNRFRGPYKAALPCVPDGDPPDLYALPGNHDWYDGLTSFTRLFCQNRWVGGWKTRQSRSYFAIALPHNWWIWAVDVQLNADVDQPQWDYFRELGARIPKDARIILCTAEPTWHVEYHEPGAYESLAWFEEHAMRPHGHRLVVGLAGDLHAYARWASDDGRQRFISGGGGAYLYPTHRFPDVLSTPDSVAPRSARDTFHLGDGADGQGALFPPARDSKKLALRSLRFPVYNPAFAAFFGVLYGVLAWLVQSASRALGDGGTSFVQTLAPGASNRGIALPDGTPDVLHALLTPNGLVAHLARLMELFTNAPLAMATLGVLLAGLVAYADGRIVGDGRPRQSWRKTPESSTVRKVIIGLVHTGFHVVAFLAVCWLMVWANVRLLRLDPETLTHSVVLAVEMVVVGGGVAGVVCGLYLFLANLARRHSNEVFACQSIPDWKHLLRFHIDRDGALTVYPIGVKAVPRDWRYRPDAGPGEAWFEATATPVCQRAELIEPPIRVPDRAGLRYEVDA